jgi:Dyp-type peroxidase family
LRRAALRAGNLQRARELFGPTRLHYETIEPVAESFGPLDPEIDARVSDVAHFAALQRRLGAGDALNEYIKHTSSALFAIPAGIAPGGYVAQRLFT